MQRLHSVCPRVSVYVPLKHFKGLGKETFGQRKPLSHSKQLVWPAGAYSPGLHLTGITVGLEHLLTTEQCFVINLFTVYKEPAWVPINLRLSWDSGPYFPINLVLLTEPQTMELFMYLA